MFSSSETVGKEATSAFGKEIKDEAERFKAVCFIIRANEKRFKKLHDNLKISAYRGRNDYPTTLTAAYTHLVRESGVYDTNNNNGGQ